MAISITSRVLGDHNKSRDELNKAFHGVTPRSGQLHNVALVPDPLSSQLATFVISFMLFLYYNHIALGKFRLGRDLIGRC